MPLKLPNLDDLLWQDLTAEARSLIPAAKSEWTNYNPSDPGITLIELFAYVSEKLMYQLNRISDKNVLEFLMLINGSEWKQNKDLLEKKEATERQRELIDEKRATVRLLQQPTRAVTVADFEQLACAVANVARAKCIPGLNLELEEPGSRLTEAPGHISVVIVVERDPRPSRKLLVKVKQALEPARLLTTRIHVVGPQYLSIGFRITIIPQRGIPPEALREEAIKRIQLFFHPLKGWFDGKGWPLGRNVYVSELYQILAELPGIDGVMPTLDPKGVLMDELALDPAEGNRLKRNPRGELEAIELHPDELVEVTIGRDDITIASRT
jgi:hypothetical protein